jgi:hypothetical protein
MDTVPVGIVKAGRPNSPTCGIICCGTPLIVCGSGSAAERGYRPATGGNSRETASCLRHLSCQSWWYAEPPPPEHRPGLNQGVSRIAVRDPVKLAKPTRRRGFELGARQVR